MTGKTGKKTMSLIRVKQRRIRLPASQKRELRTQFGALCYRYRKDKLQVLLVTSRTSGRWIVPKGWPMHKATPADTAAREAYEEAGVEGKIHPICIGFFSRTDDLGRKRLPSIVAVFPLHTKKLLSEYPEIGQRKRKWVSRKKAAVMVDNPELAQIIKGFEPKLLSK